MISVGLRVLSLVMVRVLYRISGRESGDFGGGLRGLLGYNLCP